MHEEAGYVVRQSCSLSWETQHMNECHVSMELMMWDS